MDINFDELELAVEFVSGDPSFGAEAYLDTVSGKIYYVGDGVEEEAPTDLYTNEQYRSLPSKQDLGLGRTTALDFISTKYPEEYDEVFQYFSRKGAFSKFRIHIEQIGALEQWYEYQNLALHQALQDWCDEKNIKYRC
ncbi:hypothetical protein [Vibrio sp. 10N]|uniref:hypothetical protein n=1 Tax=Vibrio sp. 10N TaxID=3058938 RepID=UPI0028138B45|nr:hypothetical protein VB10N_17080 [Vibrio sp. 10N]